MEYVKLLLALDLSIYWQGIFTLIFGYLIIGTFTSRGLYYNFYVYFLNSVESPKAKIIMASIISGLIPVEKRTSITAPVLDSMIKDDQIKTCELFHDGVNAIKKKADKRFFDESGRGKVGIIDFLSSNHFYLWAPIEKAAIIVMMGLGISYMQYMSMMLLPLIVYLGYLTYVITIYINDQEIEVESTMRHTVSGWSLLKASPFFFGVIAALFWPPVTVFLWVALWYIVVYNVQPKEIIHYIRWRVVGLLVLVSAIHYLWLSTRFDASSFYQSLSAIPIPNELFVMVSVMFAGFSTYRTGSRSAYAITGLLVGYGFGMELLPLTLLVGYSGYLFSPFHKCMGVSIAYFMTNTIEMYRHIANVCGLLVLCGIVEVFLRITY